MSQNGENCWKITHFAPFEQSKSMNINLRQYFRPTIELPGWELAAHTPAIDRPRQEPLLPAYEPPTPTDARPSPDFRCASRRVCPSCLLKVRPHNNVEYQRLSLPTPVRGQQIQNLTSNYCSIRVKRYAFLDELDLIETHVNFL